MNLEAIATACAKECVRQQVELSELRQLITAYEYAVEMAPAYERLSELNMRVIAAMIEPEKANHYRSTPVTFVNGGSSAAPQTIPSTIERMFALLSDETDADEFIRAFLQVHPFADGNGRTAFILYNWLKGKLDDPLPLPDYFGEKP